MENQKVYIGSTHEVNPVKVKVLIIRGGGFTFLFKPLLVPTKVATCSLSSGLRKQWENLFPENQFTKVPKGVFSSARILLLEKNNVCSQDIFLEVLIGWYLSRTVWYLLDWRPAMKSTALLRMIPTERSVQSLKYNLNIPYIENLTHPRSSRSRRWYWQCCGCQKLQSLQDVQFGFSPQETPIKSFYHALGSGRAHRFWFLQLFQQLREEAKRRVVFALRQGHLGRDFQLSGKRGFLGY